MLIQSVLVLSLWGSRICLRVPLRPALKRIRYIDNFLLHACIHVGYWWFSHCFGQGCQHPLCQWDHSGVRRTQTGNKIMLWLAAIPKCLYHLIVFCSLTWHCSKIWLVRTWSTVLTLCVLMTSWIIWGHPSPSGPPRWRTALSLSPDSSIWYSNRQLPTRGTIPIW